MYHSIQVVHDIDAHAAYVYGDDSFVRRIHHDDPIYDSKMKPYIEAAESIEDYNLCGWQGEPAKIISEFGENIEPIESADSREFPYSAQAIALAYGIGIIAAVAINHEYLFGEDNPSDPFGFI
jgi:hypothetical protein